MCRGLHVVESRPALYVAVHEQIVAAVGSVLPIEKVMSIDEMACLLPVEVRTVEECTSAAHAVKRAIAARAGPCSNVPSAWHRTCY